MYRNFVEKLNYFFSNNLSIIKNSSWIIIEKLLSIFGLIFITSYVAKYIGPDNFGKLSYAISIFIIIQTVSMLGTDTILFKRISKNRDSGISLMLSTIELRILLYILISILFTLYSIYTTKDHITIIFTISVALSYLFLAIDHYAIYFNAILQSKINVLFNIIGISISLSLRYLIVLFELNIIYFSIPIILTTLLPFIFRCIYFHRKTTLKKIKKRKPYIIYLMKQGLPISISNVSITVYSKISQIFLSLLISNYALGIYTVASTLAYAWLFLPQAVITSYFTKIYSTNNKKEILQLTAYLNLFIIFISVLYLIIIYFFGEKIILILYGIDYIESANIIFYLSIASVFSSLGIVSYRYIVAFSGYSFLSKKMFFTSFLGILLTYVLIKEYAITGAVLASILIEIVSLTVFNYFFKNKLVFFMHIKTILIIFNFSKKHIKE
ncbi:TPA: oligosaccharide flippase family protein [Proteus mirabilis]